MLLSQDEARFPMVPTLGPTLGVKGHRPVVGTRDCKDRLYAFAVVDPVTAAVPSHLVESPARAKRRTGKSPTRRLQEAFAAHLRHVGRLDQPTRTSGSCGSSPMPRGTGEAHRRSPGRSPTWNSSGCRATARSST